MSHNKTLTFATLNLFNFIEPPSAYYDFENIYDQQSWQEKCDWTKEQVRQLNPDVIGMQEVFSIGATKRLFAELGYPYFATLDTPHIESDYIYSKPVVAIASRYPIKQAQLVTPCGTIEQTYGVQPPAFSRQPIFATLSVPMLGDIAVYVCHLKSQRPTESKDENQSHRLIGSWLSSQQRGWEALMLRLFMEQQYQQAPMPTVLMGDMNQSLDFAITGLLTQSVEAASNQLKLQDSWTIYSKAKPDLVRQPTHYHFAKGNVLDYILLSQEFQAESPYSLADVINYTVLDQHLINPIYSQDKQASDHAFVAVTARLVL